MAHGQLDWNELPVQAVACVVSHLTLRDCARAELVSASWRQLLRSLRNVPFAPTTMCIVTEELRDVNAKAALHRALIHGNLREIQLQCTRLPFDMFGASQLQEHAQQQPKLSNLTALTLSDTRSVLGPQLMQLTNLQRLRLIYCKRVQKIQLPPAVSSLEVLECMPDISSTLLALKNLRVLRLAKSGELEEELRVITHLTGLTSLSVSVSRTGNHWNNIFQLTSLQQLELEALSEEVILPDTLSNLTGLQHLRVASKARPGAGAGVVLAPAGAGAGLVLAPSCFSGLSRLASLALSTSGRCLETVLPPSFSSQLSSLTSLSLTHWLSGFEGEPPGRYVIPGMKPWLAVRSLHAPLYLLDNLAPLNNLQTSLQQLNLELGHKAWLPVSLSALRSLTRLVIVGEQSIILSRTSPELDINISYKIWTFQGMHKLTDLVARSTGDMIRLSAEAAQNLSALTSLSLQARLRLPDPELFAGKAGLKQVVLCVDSADAEKMSSMHKSWQKVLPWAEVTVMEPEKKKEPVV